MWRDGAKADHGGNSDQRAGDAHGHVDTWSIAGAKSTATQTASLAQTTGTAAATAPASTGCPYPAWSGATTDRVDIATALMTSFLRCYLGYSSPADQHIRNYRIDLVTIHTRSSGGGLVALVIYDVQRANASTYWLAGNGAAATDGWVKNKTVFMTVSRGGDTYQITGIATSP